MVEVRLLDVYEAAYLAGGPDRVVDTAVVALLETGRVRAQSTGELCVVEDKPRHEIEAAALDAIGSGGWREIETVRWRAGQDERLAALAERLRRDGLLSGNSLARLLGRLGQPVSLTTTGRRALRELRADPPVRGVAAGTSAARVALDGTGGMPDPELRSTVFHQQQRPSGPRRRGRAAGYRDASPGRHWAPYGCGGGGASCGSGHGGGCGGGGCGGGG